MSDITVTISGESYLVSGEGRDATVRVRLRRPCIGFRTLKSSSALWKAAVKLAVYERSLKAGAR